MPRVADRLVGHISPASTERTNSRNMFSSDEIERNRRISQTLSRVSVGSSNIKRIYVETENGTAELDESQHHHLMDIIQEANMDGVRHLKGSNSTTRVLWAAVIVVFIALAMFQIYSQIMLYHKHPVATNIEAEYPNSLPFPAIAICNNNQFRLTYITGARIMNRKMKEHGRLKSLQRGHNKTSVFEQVLEKTWDMDAVKFLRSAAHWKSRMILGCTWPNGTTCRLSDFKAVWTTTGLCWAINTDQHDIHQVIGSGAGHGLKLLLNVESYERVDACTPHFRTMSLPGLKVLIYNQSDHPDSSLNGVNVPSGYSMDIPFRIQHRSKLPGVHCTEEIEEYMKNRDDFNSESNLRTCTIRQYLSEIEKQCNCSMRRAYTPNFVGSYNTCNVDEYFGCVMDVVRRVQDKGTQGVCQPPCQVIDYIAWQDMNRMPANLMPALIEEHEEEDESDVWQEDIDEERYLERSEREGETFSCKDSAFIDDKQVQHIKRDAHRAYEKQSRYQEDIFLRTKRLILRLRAAIQDLNTMKFGWHADQFTGIFVRLNESQCFQDFRAKHDEMAHVMRNKPTMSEEKRSKQLHSLVDPDSYTRNPNRFKTIGDVKATYGDKVEEVLSEIQIVLNTVEKMWNLYDESSYHSQLSADFARMDRIEELMRQYEFGHLQRRVWGDKMQSRQMRHFFDEEFYDEYYQTIVKDLDHSLMKVIGDIENEEWPKLFNLIENGTALTTGAILFFDDSSDENVTKFNNFVFDVYNCTVGEVKDIANITLKNFKKSFRHMQAAYTNLFKKELPDYLENFEFGDKFVSDNFAMVNVFLHQMHMEKWSQDTTYTFWSLACDIGGALGLFLGASLLTIIELIYLCFHHGLCGKRRKQSVDMVYTRPMHRERNIVYRPYDPSVTDVIDKSPRSPTAPMKEAQPQISRPKRNIWSSPYDLHGQSVSNQPSPVDELEREGEWFPPPRYSDEEYQALPTEDYNHYIDPDDTGYYPNQLDPFSDNLHVDTARLSEIMEERSPQNSDERESDSAQQEAPDEESEAQQLLFSSQPSPNKMSTL